MSQDKLTLLALSILEHLEGSKGSTSGDNLVGELGLVGLTIIVGLLVGIVGFSCAGSCVSRVTRWGDEVG